MKLRMRGLAIAVTTAIASGVLIATPSPAATTVVVWADETRGPNLIKTLVTP